MLRLLKLARMGAVGLSVLLCIVSCIIFYTRPDVLAGVTVIPAGAWLIPGVGLLALGISRVHWRSVVVVGCLWLLFTALYVGEARSLLRRGEWPDPEWAQARLQGKALRIVTFNYSYKKEALKEIIPYQPDIVLLQEAWAPDVEAVAPKICGKFPVIAQNGSKAIITRGIIRATHADPVQSFVQGEVALDSGIEINVTSLHLVSHHYRKDVWSPQFHKDEQKVRQIQRQEMSAVAQQVERIPEQVPMILGGDFNAPAGDAIFRTLQPRLHDSFREGGCGWGNTIFNDKPMQRIDQIWLSKNFRATTVMAVKSRYSQHKMVICDVIVK